MPRHPACHSLLLAALLLLSVTADAAMYIDRSEIQFRPGESGRQDVTITNPDAEPLYVRVDVTEVFRAGTPDEERRVATEAADIRLLATPNKVVVPPGQQRAVRLVNVAGHGDAERVFRVKFTPVVGRIEPGEGSMAVKVVVAYDILVVVPPAKPEPGLEAARNGTNITFRNTGNTNIYLFNGQQCTVAEADSAPSTCTSVGGTRLYAGATWSTTLPHDLPVDFFVSILGNNERRRFD